jgi:hypothetical protein
MEKNKLKKVIQTLLNTSFSGLTIDEFRMMPIYDFNFDTSKFTLSRHTILMNVKKTTIDENTFASEIESVVESYLGYECSVEIS